MDLKAFKNETNGRWTLEGVEPSEKTFDRICQMLRDGINFKFARYGDGELMCMSGKIGKNCDGHEYFPDLGMALNDAFYSDPKYMVGIQPLSVDGGLYQRAVQYRPGPKNIYDADVLHSASIDGRLQEFLMSLLNRYTILVGPGHLIPLNFDDHVLIPSVNCWRDYNNIVHRLYSTVAMSSDVVVLLCASMMSEVIIDALRDFPITMIDVGSCFDPIVGKFSRSYHHKLKLNAN